MSSGAASEHALKAPSEDTFRWTPGLVRVVAGLMVSIFVAAMDTTVVSTALPTVAHDLGGFSLYAWVFSGYLLTSTTSVPLWGRSADVFGRKRVLLLGLGVFVAASVLCAVSPNMVALIAARTLQGVGAGCIQPVVFTVVGDLLPVRERGRFQGLFSGMWATAAIAGPLLGAGFVSTIGWRWIFVINVPLGLVAAALLWGYRDERPSVRERPGLDLGGAFLFTVGTALLLIGLGTGSASGRPNPWVLVVAIVALAAFFVVEVRSSSPTIPLHLLRHRVIGPAILVAVLGGTVQFGVTVFAPLFVQDGLGGTAFEAGTTISPMLIGWPLASVVAGWTLLRVGYERLVLAGALAVTAGTIMLALTGSWGYVWVAASCGAVGVGLGLFTAPLLIVIQASVSWSERGAATALNQLARTIGGAAGVSLMGVVVQSFVAGAGRRAGLPAGIHAVFASLVLIGIAILGCAVAILVLEPRGRGGAGSRGRSATLGRREEAAWGERRSADQVVAPLRGRRESHLRGGTPLSSRTLRWTARRRGRERQRHRKRGPGSA